MSPRGSPRTRFWPIRALVVDDDRPTRDLLRSRLRSMGIIDVWEADDGKTALAILRDFNCGDPDVVICDLDMAELDGLRFCDSVRRDKTLSCRDVPILLLARDADGEVFRRARQRGATEVLTRRAAARDLDRHLREIVGIEAPA